jgi:putative ABC transport system permease protein
MVSECLRRLRCILRRREMEQGLDEEIRFHIDQQIEKDMRAGMSRADAHRQALVKFGGGAQYVKERAGDEFRFALLEDSWRDLRHGLRALRRAPGFTIVASVTLALGIGAATAVFSVVNGVLIRPLPYPDADALIGVWHTAPGTNMPGDVPISATQYFTYQEENRTFQGFGLWARGSATVTGIGEPEQVPALRVTYGTLPALGVSPSLGRWFSREDDSPASPETVLFTYGYWQRRYGGDRSAIGRTIIVDSTPRTVIGVMPERFRFLNQSADLILPFRFNRGELFLGEFNYQGLARLRPGVSVAQANADAGRMVPIWLNAWSALPGLDKQFIRNARITPAVRPLKQDVVGDISGALWVVMGMIGIVLLIACANVANLLLVRAEGRQQETAVRAALGAGRWRLLREWLLESLALTSLSGVLGVVLAVVILRVLVAIGPSTLPRLDEISIDRAVLSFAAIVSIVAGLLFGAIPVLRHGGFNVAPALGGASRSFTSSRDRHRARQMLVVVQVALALVLLVGAGLMIRSFLALRAVDPGFAGADHLQLVRVAIPETQIENPERVIRMQSDIRDAVAAIPGVSSAAFASAAPMEPFSANDVLLVESHVYREGELPPIRRFKFVSPGFFETVGIRLIAGRDLTWIDLSRHSRVAVISENLARELWRDPAAALGKRIRENPAGPWHEVVGVVSDVHDDGLQEAARTTVYWPMLIENFWGNPVQVQRAVTYVIRSDQAGLDALLNQIRRAVWSVNGSLPLAQVRTLAGVVDGSLARTSFTVVMLAIAGGIALLLGTVGIYGVIAYTIAQRTREIGIRAALGAQRSELRRMFVRHAVSLAAIGVVCGLGAAAGLARFMTSLLFGTAPLDATTYAGVAGLLLAVAAVASYVPAHRATGVDPVESLRAD